MKDKKLKAKGRAIGALRMGARTARQLIEEDRKAEAIETLDLALSRADRMERDA